MNSPWETEVQVWPETEGWVLSAAGERMITGCPAMSVPVEGRKSLGVGK